MQTNKNGKVIWHGASLINGEPIVAIVTGLETGSKNGKTGAMIQTWILGADLAPNIAVYTGADEAVCGGCSLRNNGCYVRTGDAPRSVYWSFQRGSYGAPAGLEDLPGIGEGRFVRLGSYGDPAAVPVAVWERLISRAAGWTAYTHQWATHDPILRANVLKLRSYAMASAETAEQAAEAQRLGWRTFRVRSIVKHDPRMKGEANCPASAEAGHKLACIDCGVCSGWEGKGTGNVELEAHGARKGRI